MLGRLWPKALLLVALAPWRAGTTPQALLGVRLITAPPAPTGTSPEHVIEYAGVRR